VFEVVAGTNSKDTFVALCLLTVCGTAIATQHLGFGQTLGAFLAGVLLAETSYRNQVGGGRGGLGARGWACELLSARTLQLRRGDGGACSVRARAACH